MKRKERVTCQTAVGDISGDVSSPRVCTCRGVATWVCARATHSPNGPAGSRGGGVNGADSFCADKWPLGGHIKVDPLTP